MNVLEDTALSEAQQMDCVAPVARSASAVKRKRCPGVFLKFCGSCACTLTVGNNPVVTAATDGGWGRGLLVISIKFKLMLGDTEDRGGSLLIKTLMGYKKIALRLLTAL